MADLKEEWSAELVARHVKTIDPDAAYVFEKSEVPMQTQAKLASVGFKTIAQLRGLGETRAEIAEVVKTDLGIDPKEGGGGGLRKRAAVAAIQAAWEMAKDYVERKSVIDADDRINGIPRSLKLMDYANLVKALEQAVGYPMDEESAPAQCLIERLLAELEEGQWKATPLDEAATRKEAEHEGVRETPMATKDGYFKLTRRGKLKVGAPKTSEEYRKRCKILGNALSMAKLKMSNQSWLQTMTVRAMEEHTEYILGPSVRGFTAKDANGHDCMVPPWHLIMAYEFRVRDQAADLVNLTRLDAAGALKAARLDTDIKQRYFTHPMAVTLHGSAGRERSRDGRYQEGGWNWDQKGNGKAKGAKGKDKGAKGKAGKGGKGAKLNYNTADGREICFKFQKGAGFCDGSCNRVHACQVCLSLKHGYKSCPQTTSKKF